MILQWRIVATTVRFHWKNWQEKTIWQSFFTPTDDPEKFKCNECSKILKQASANGQTNLISHVDKQHKDCIQEIAKEHHRKENQRMNGMNTLDNYDGAIGRKLSPKALTMYGWLDWIIMNNFSFTFVESPCKRKYSFLAHTRKYFLNTGNLVNENIKRALPDCRWLWCWNFYFFKSNI